MDDKLRRLMKHEGINSTRLAEILGIQASGISHIMSGRNKPSYDFLLKLLQRFPQISPDWLLLDKGPMYRDEIKKGGASAGSHPAAGSTGAGSSVSGISGGGAGAGIAFAGSVGPDNTQTRASGKLFGPDEGDIIPSDRQSGAYPGGYRDMYQGAQPAGSGLQASGQANMQTHHRSTGRPTALPTSQQVGQPTEQPTSQQAVYQTGNLVRSASVERIVVFYKDKTFSEYRPEQMALTM